jgi:single-stranded DNA-specific DHH superfamily exonuclease
MGQEQATLKPIIEGIKHNLGDTIFDTSVVLTADTGFSSEANMQYLFEENINAVIPDHQFRKRNPVFTESDLYNLLSKFSKSSQLALVSCGSMNRLIITSKNF